MADRNVYFAKITRRQLGAFDRSFAEDLVIALDPRHEATRYNKTWRLSRPVLRAGFIVGKLGFVRTTHAAETRYDDALEDFVTAEGEASQGSYSVFAIDVDREIMAFEERLPDIRRQSFMGAFRALLKEADFRADVNLLSDPTEYEEFLQTIDRVQRIRTVVFAPNPGPHEDARNLNEIIEQANAERAEVTAVARRGETLNPEAQWVRGALGHISEHGEGTLKVTGYKDEHKRVWTFGSRLQVAVITDQDADSPEGVWEWMLRQLRERFRG